VWEIGHSRLATCVQTLEAHTHWVSGLAVAPDGSRLASASRRGWPKRRDEFMEFPGDLLPL